MLSVFKDARFEKPTGPIGEREALFVHTYIFLRINQPVTAAHDADGKSFCQGGLDAPASVPIELAGVPEVRGHDLALIHSRLLMERFSGFPKCFPSRRGKRGQ